jgi:cardiolipin synthase
MKMIKRLFNFMGKRLFIMAFLVILEIFLFVFLLANFNYLFRVFEIIFRLFGLFVVLCIIRYNEKPGNQILWIVLIMMFPFVGSILYLLGGLNIITDKHIRKVNRKEKETEYLLRQDKKVLQSVMKENMYAGADFNFLNNCNYPVYDNTDVKYYKCGEDAFDDMLFELNKAKKYIFLEYFIITPGIMWTAILDVLKKKVKEGVEVRVIYDDVGCINTLPTYYKDALESFGIKCIPFNRVSPVVQLVVNNRDHRKMMIIDGKTVFTGGINIADEYINKIEKFGYWKDSVLKITGDAVWTYIVMFLRTWDGISKEEIDYYKYKNKTEVKKAKGYIAPYGSNPFRKDYIAEEAYMSIITHANKYIYIMTPYLVLDSDILSALTLAAKRGVEIKIMLPGIPDKKYIYMLSRSYYRPLLKAGIKIYEYDPGFLHTKMMIADDLVCSIGTINLDYRSLYLHFECSSFMYECSCINDIRDDFNASLKKCTEVDMDDASPNIRREIIQLLLRLIAPLL